MADGQSIFKDAGHALATRGSRLPGAHPIKRRPDTPDFSHDSKVAIVDLPGRGGLGSDTPSFNVPHALTQEKKEMKFKKSTCAIGLAMLLSLQPVLAQHATGGNGAATTSPVEDPLLKARASAKADKAELKSAKAKLKADQKANADKSVIAADEARIKLIQQSLQEHKASARVEMQRRAVPVAM